MSTGMLPGKLDSKLVQSWHEESLEENYRQNDNYRRKINTREENRESSPDGI